MRRFLAILLTGGLLLLGPLALAGGASAATTIAPTTTCGNGVGNVGGRGLICEVTIANRITASGGSATVTVRECQGAAGPPATQTACTKKTISLTKPVTAVTQCNDSLNGGGGTLRCSVKVTNEFIGVSPGATAVTVNQCVGSAGGGGITIVCDPFPATTSGATITQCNGSANGGGLVASSTCTATGTESSGAALKINQCNGSANGGGALIICSANVTSNTSNAAAPGSSPGATPASPGATPASPGATPASPGATPASPGATPAPSATRAPSATPAPSLPPTSTTDQITAQRSGTSPLVLVGLLFLVALSLITAFRRYGDPREVR
jgi:hypothetical protein